MDIAASGPSDGIAGFTRSSLIVIILCAMIFFLDGLIHTVMGPMAPEIAKELALDYAALGPIFSANLIGQTFGLVTFPLAAMRYGHRPVILVSVLGFVLAQILTALAWDASSLFAFRLIDGIFLGGCMPSCLALVTKVAPPFRRGFAVTLLFTGYGSGATMSGVVAAGFADHGGWRMAVLMVGTISAATGLAAWLWLRGIDDAPGANDDKRGHSSRINALEVVSRRHIAGTMMLWLLFISMLTIQYCLSSWLPTLLVEVGRDEDFAALSVTIFSLGGIISALGVGLLIDRFGATPVLATFLSIATIMLLAIGQLIATASEALLMLLLMTGGFFFLGAYGGVNVVLATYYPQAISAAGIGLAKSIGRVGTILAPIVIGLGLSAGVSEMTVMSSFAFPAALATLAVLVIGYQVRKRDRGQERSQA